MGPFRISLARSCVPEAAARPWLSLLPLVPPLTPCSPNPRGHGVGGSISNLIPRGSATALHTPPTPTPWPSSALPPRPPRRRSPCAAITKVKQQFPLDILFLAGDFNARVGSLYTPGDDVVGPHTVKEENTKRSALSCPRSPLSPCCCRYLLQEA